jgi:hypothetical protein
MRRPSGRTIAILILSLALAGSLALNIFQVRAYVIARTQLDSLIWNVAGSSLEKAERDFIIRASEKGLRIYTTEDFGSKSKDDAYTTQ